MEDDSTFKEHYFFELDRRGQLNGSLTFPVGIIALLAGAIYAMSQSITSPVECWKGVLAVMLFAGAVCLVISIVYLVRAYWNYTYKYMPFGDELLAHKLALVAYHRNLCSDPKATTDAMRDFKEDLDASYAKYGRINSLNNDSKSSQIFRANCFLIGALACTIFCMPIFMSLRFISSPEPSKIEIVNLKEIEVTQKNENTEQTQPTRQDQQQQTQHQRPAMPPGREVKEHVDPLKNKNG